MEHDEDLETSRMEDFTLALRRLDRLVMPPVIVSIEAIRLARHRTPKYAWRTAAALCSLIAARCE